MPETEFLTPEQAAQKLQVHPRTVKRLLGQGKLPGQKVGNQWRIPWQALQKYMEGEPKPEEQAKVG
jgi:excisionase family DNA binding protein